MKIKVMEKSKKQKELEIGKKGDLILVRMKGKKGYSFGRLEEVAEETIATKSSIFDRDSGNKINVQHVAFDGNSYRLDSINVMGVSFPYFSIRPAQRYRRSSFDGSRHLDVRYIEKVVSGGDNVINYLKNHENPKYRGHADLIRKIVEEQGI